MGYLVLQRVVADVDRCGSGQEQPFNGEHQSAKPSVSTHPMNMGCGAKVSSTGAAIGTEGSAVLRMDYCQCRWLGI